MHPALSVILFTTAAGVGYGLLALAGLFAATGLLPADPAFGPVAVVLALAVVTVGLLSSTRHLGRPERAWRALSQWRTSWLSREGVAAVATNGPALLFALAWWSLGPWHPLTALLGLAAAALAGVTVYCTAMIYASLKTVHQWHTPLVPRNYAALSIFTGALWLNALAVLWGGPHGGLALLALAAGILALAAKRQYWTYIDGTAAASTPESATGLGGIGRVRLFEAPHTEANYLMREMGFVIARKHAAKLRRIALLLGFAAPLALTLLTVVNAPVLPALAAVLAAAAGAAGVFVERWLFFAEAKHTVTLYYGAAAA